MEAMQANITGMCPLSFGGVTGGMFLRAVTTVVAAHCSIFEDYRWPKDAAGDIINNAKDGITYDFIVVGAGTAGSLVAGRLAELYPSWSILLVEAGDAPGLNSEIPAFLFFNLNTYIDWNYNIFPDGKSCLGFRNNTCIWSKGKGLGGSSSINAMLYVRGHPKDFDNWEQSGNSDWGYKALSSYFEIIEKDFKLYNYKYPDHPLFNVIEEAWKEINYTTHKKSRDESIIGLKMAKLLIDNGKRLNTAKLHLRSSDNLQIMRNTVVRKLIIDTESKEATGIQIQHKSGFIMEIYVRKEVILSAGSIGTPQILMLSGIGPKKHLVDKGIKQVIDLPVGQNLQDHLILPLFLKTNQHTTLTSEMTTSMLIQYMLSKTGPLSTIGIIDIMGFIDTINNYYPDIQYHHTYYTKKDSFALRPYLQALGYNEEIIKNVEKLNEGSDLLGIFPTLLHPKSIGEVLLANNDPASQPIIKANYLDHPDDINRLITAIDFILQLTNTTGYKSLGANLLKLDIPACLHDTKNYWKCYIRHIATTIYHPVGTAKMGSKYDKTSVVDQELCVHGINKLRVVDASIMPSIPSGNTMASTLVIAAKAVDLIKKKYARKDEL